MPAGYAFNGDGVCLYLGFASLYIAQAFGIDLSLGEQIALLAVFLITSKGSAGVAGSGFIILAATLSTTGTVPVVGIMLILGVDRFLSTMRGLVSLGGQMTGSLLVSHWEGELDVERARTVLDRQRPAPRTGRRPRDGAGRLMRLPYAEDGGEAAERIRARRGGELRSLDRLLLHSPPVADGGTACSARSASARRCRATCASWRSCAWPRSTAPITSGRRTSRSPAARASATRRSRRSAPATPTRSASCGASVLALTDAMTRDVEVPQELFEALRGHFDERGIVELTATIGTYNLVSRFIVALELTP